MQCDVTHKPIAIDYGFASRQAGVSALYKKTRKNPGQQMAQFQLKPPGGEPENVTRIGQETFNFQV
jgi:hypothetical protein